MTKFKTGQAVLICPNFVDASDDTSTWHIGKVLKPIDVVVGENWYSICYTIESEISGTRPASKLRAFVSEDDMDTLVSL